MGYCMSVDGGGTKLACVLFNEQYNLVSYGNGRAINYVNEEEIVETINSCVDKCLNNQNIDVLDRVYISMPASAELFIKLLQQKVTVSSVIYLNEGRMSLLAGLQLKQGIVALAGTGSGLFQVDGYAWRHVGGWGNLLGDEGSAYYIGQEGIRAVLENYESRGEQSAIRAILEQEWGCHNKQELIDFVYDSDKPRTTIASASILVARAASTGDKRATRIFEQGGREMALQAKAFLTHLPLTGSADIVIAGSVWKGCDVMYNTFKQEIGLFHQGVRVHMPLFEPVIGGVVARLLETSENVHPEFVAYLTGQFARYLYVTQWERG